MAPIHDAAESGNLTEVMTLVEEDMERVDSIEDERGITPLHLAAIGDHVEIMAYLLDHGALIDKLTISLAHEGNGPNFTALYVACTKGHVRATDLLLERGADPTITCGGLVPLMQASFNNCLDCVKSLVKHDKVWRTINVQGKGQPFSIP